ncbi:MAG: SIS domain-containing protein [Bacteroidales bacterium]|nr:SIS domain-containing protein [Bacteroidales bacterium]
MKYFNTEGDEFASKGAGYTAREIWEQPEVWQKTFQKLVKEKDELSEFFQKALAASTKIILTGAGTSAYIGLSIEGTFQRMTGITTVSIPTTHLVTHATDYLEAEEHTFVISFARSGNSPESVATVKLIDKMCASCTHLVITCDKDGELARYSSPNDKYTFVLPDESNDRSLAMTSSYTSMLLTGLLLPRLEKITSMEREIDTLMSYGKQILESYSPEIKKVAGMDFKRAVVLGSGPLFGTSTESHLKLQELTDGQIVCKKDSYMAFRHGPKAVIDEQTLVIFLFSNNPLVQRYELDLVNSLDKGKRAMALIGVSESQVKDVKLDLEICYGNSRTQLEEDLLTVCSVLPAQILGLFKSLDLGLKPDNPSVTGAIARVVEGVTIYES